LTLLNYHHTIPEREEPIPLLDSGTIRSEGLFPAEERAHEHYQRTFGQMKIRYQPVDTFELIARVDENARIVDRFARLGGAFESSA